ncbi:uncharacterized protein EV420DRAFT_1301331 [Desarmillaria tabescens]|uniref:DNA replication regulator SLD2 n=1 Tax=Armillaria tabescens TaxID=1929756 RepID=A0AA39NJ08_ARMTA|nr:uncharacterized protein EV420DRAFT_1301331 [Desarmillaria tabescens]KAK0466429.1 hypothetical protein EV420DRAFT_1301331 [Desarmillaria tabescens]
MSDLATVKAEIKAWEREFKSKHGRSAQVQDIKEHPDIETKYKLYKALGKASSAKVSSYTPTTPSKSQKHEPSRLLPKARASETTAPLSTFNPFSPQKNKGKQKAVLPVNNDFRSNPFASPSKVKSRAPVREVSPLPAVPFQPLIFPTESAIPEPTSAIARARKRLRGEPVSPSPSKEKRRRVASGHNIPISRTEDSASDEDHAHVGNLSFVDDSPIKGSNGFKLLFDDTKQPKSLFPHSRTDHSSSDVFSSLGDGMDWKGLQNPKVNHDSKTNGKPFPNSAASSNVYQKPRGPTKKSTHAPVNIAAPKPRKRVLSDADAAESSSSNRAPSLIPPSPPPPDASKRSHGVFKGKGKATSSNGRKKAKFTTTTLNSDNDEEPNEKIRVVRRTYSSPRKDTSGRNSDADADDTFDAPSHPQIENVGDGQDTGRFDVDLPDRFLHVLAFSPYELRARDYQEVRVVEGLLYGRRADHYDPSRGGEIWDVGEDEHGDRQVAVADEGEDDWQGEPVPWELGEL